MPQNDYIHLNHKFNGRQLNFENRNRKKTIRHSHNGTKIARNLRGIKAKIFARSRLLDKIKPNKVFKEKRNSDKSPSVNALPTYLLERQTAKYDKLICESLKKRRKEKNGKLEVPVPRVQPISDDEMLKVYKSGKRGGKTWRRIVTKVTFVDPRFTRKPPKYDRFIRPSSMRMHTANVTHPDLKITVRLEILRVDKNPNGQIYTGLGVITLGTIIEVNVSEMGLNTLSGNVVWCKYAQVTNNPENDGVINAVLMI